MVSYLFWQSRQLSEPPTAVSPRGPNIRASIYRVSQSKTFPASLCSYKFVWSFYQMAYFPGNFTQSPRKIGCYPSIATIVVLTSITMSPVIVEMSDTGWQAGRGLVRALGKILSTARPVLPPRCQPPDPIAFYFLSGEENGLCYKMALYTGSIFWLDNTKFNFTSSGSFQPRFLNHKVYFCKNRDLLPHRPYQELRILNFIQRL